MQLGAFVPVMFPTRERPRVPGLLHIGYVLACSVQEAMVAYTTSQPWPDRVPLPAGARVFSLDEARSLNQTRSFMLRMDTLAKLPLTSEWFPDIAKSDGGTIAVAPARLQSELLGLATKLLRRRRELVEIRGA